MYRRLAYDARFAPKPGSRPMLANDMLAPRPHIDPRKAAEVSDEEREDEATEANEKAADAFVVSEAGEDASGTGAQRPALQKTVKTSERPAAAPPPSPAERRTSSRSESGSQPESRSRSGAARSDRVRSMG